MRVGAKGGSNYLDVALRVTCVRPSTFVGHIGLSHQFVVKRFVTDSAPISYPASAPMSGREGMVREAAGESHGVAQPFIGWLRVRLGGNGSASFDI